MATVSAYTTDELADRVESVSREEGRKVGQVAASALALYASLPSGARRAFLELSATRDQRATHRMTAAVARALLNAKWDLLSARIAEQINSRGDIPEELTEEEMAELAVRIVEEVDESETALAGR